MLSSAKGCGVGEGAGGRGLGMGPVIDLEAAVVAHVGSGDEELLSVALAVVPSRISTRD